MREQLTSRERLLLAIDHQEADRVPICFRSFGQVAPLETRDCWGNAFERAAGLAELGVDDVVRLHLPWFYHPDVTVRQWWHRRPGEPRPFICKELATPRGVLRLTVQQSPDWIPQDLPLHADQNWGRGVEFPVYDFADLEKLAYLLYDPRLADLSPFRQHAQAHKSFASVHGLLVESEVFGLTQAIALMGPRRFLYAVIDERDFVFAFLEMIHDWDMKRLGVLLDAGVDVIYCSGCYEVTEFFSPALIRELFLPFHKRMIEAVHQAGAKLHYYTVTGIMPLLADYRGIGVDILSSLDPMGSGGPLRMNAVDLAQTKREIGDAVCLWGGVDPENTLEQGTAAEVREAVRTAIETCAPGGGFVLSLAGDIRSENACSEGVYENVMAFIEAGHEFGRYPLGG